MKNEAKANEASDKAAREQVEKLNAADSLVFQSEKQIKEFGDKIPADKKSAIENGIQQLKDAHKSQDINAIDKATEALNAAWTAASQDMYNASQQAGGPEAGAQGGASANAGASAAGDNVTDAEFEEVK